VLAESAEREVVNKVDRGEAYYHFAMGHLYAELAIEHGNRGDYLKQAIEHYKKAIEADPDAGPALEELAEVYIQAGRLSEAVSEAEDRLKKNPGDVDARRVLGRIYIRVMGDPQAARINETMLRKAIEQYEKIVELKPKDLESWLMLGRLYRVARNSVKAENVYQKALALDPSSEEALTGLALVYSDVGDSKRASEMLKKVVERNPNLRTLSALAGSLEDLKDYGGAAVVLKRALDMAPERLELKRALAQDLLLSNQIDDALKLYLEIAKADPNDVQTRLRLSQIYRQKRDFEKARQAAEEAERLDPDSLEARFNEVNLLEAEGRILDAISVLERILNQTSKQTYNENERANHLIVLERLALLYRSAEKYQEAVTTFRKMTEIDPEIGARVAAQVTETYRMAKDFQKALEEADRGYAKYPKDRTLAMVRASLLADLGRHDAAVAEAKKLLGVKPDRETYLAVAQIYEKLKDYKEMGKLLDAAEGLAQSNEDKASVHFMRGAMYERMKRYEQAEAEFRKVLELDPDNSSAMNYLGYMFADRNVQLQEAEKLIARALELEPENGPFLDSLGWVYYKMGRLNEAEAYLRRALQKVSRDPTVRDHLGDVLAKQGKLKEAVAEWQISLKEWDASAPSEKDPTEVAKIAKKLEGAKIRLAKEESRGNR